MPTPPDLTSQILDAWRTSDRVTTDLIRALPPELWKAEIPGMRRKTVRDLGAHFHNTRCRWLRILAEPHEIAVPARVDRRRVTRRQVVAALKRSGRGMTALLELGLHSGGEVPATRRYVWRNLPLDVGHVLSYFVAHEAHHRGQIVMIARQAGHRLPAAVVNGLWWWKGGTMPPVPARASRKTPRTKRRT